MNKHDRFGGIIRFFQVQVAMRVSRSPLIWKWIGETRIIINPAESGLTQNVYCGLHEFADMLFIIHCLRNEDLFIDIGANVGSYTILASGVVGCKTCSFEPAPATFSRLRDNIALNRLNDRTSLYQCALGNTKGQVSFTSNENCTNHVSRNEKYSSEDCVVVPIEVLDEMLQEREPLLMKIDVEGYELPVLRGAQRVLSRPSLRGVIMELNGSGSRYGFDEASIINQMRAYGFQTASYDPFNRRIELQNGKCLTSGNTLFLRDLDFINKRLSEANAIQINRQLL